MYGNESDQKIPSTPSSAINIPIRQRGTVISGSTEHQPSSLAKMSFHANPMTYMTSNSRGDGISSLALGSVRGTSSIPSSSQPPPRLPRANTFQVYNPPTTAQAPNHPSSIPQSYASQAYSLPYTSTPDSRLLATSPPAATLSLVPQTSQPFSTTRTPQTQPVIDALAATYHVSQAPRSAYPPTAASSVSPPATPSASTTTRSRLPSPDASPQASPMPSPSPSPRALPTLNRVSTTLTTSSKTTPHATTITRASTNFTSLSTKSVRGSPRRHARRLSFSNTDRMENQVVPQFNEYSQFTPWEEERNQQNQRESLGKSVNATEFESTSSVGTDINSENLDMKSNMTYRRATAIDTPKDKQKVSSQKSAHRSSDTNRSLFSQSTPAHPNPHASCLSTLHAGSLGCSHLSHTPKRGADLANTLNNAKIHSSSCPLSSLASLAGYITSQTASSISKQSNSVNSVSKPSIFDSLLDESPSSSVTVSDAALLVAFARSAVHGGVCVHPYQELLDEDDYAARPLLEDELSGLNDSEKATDKPQPLSFLPLPHSSPSRPFKCLFAHPNTIPDHDDNCKIRRPVISTNIASISTLAAEAVLGRNQRDAPVDGRSHQSAAADDTSVAVESSWCGPAAAIVPGSTTLSTASSSLSASDVAAHVHVTPRLLWLLQTLSQANALKKQQNTAKPDSTGTMTSFLNESTHQSRYDLENVPANNDEEYVVHPETGVRVRIAQAKSNASSNTNLQDRDAHPNNTDADMLFDLVCVGDAPVAAADIGAAVAALARARVLVVEADNLPITKPSADSTSVSPSIATHLCALLPYSLSLTPRITHLYLRAHPPVDLPTNAHRLHTLALHPYPDWRQRLIRVSNNSSAVTPDARQPVLTSVTSLAASPVTPFWTMHLPVLPRAILIAAHALTRDYYADSHHHSSLHTRNTNSQSLAFSEIPPFFLDCSMDLLYWLLARGASLRTLYHHTRVRVHVGLIDALLNAFITTVHQQDDVNTDVDNVYKHASKSNNTISTSVDNAQAVTSLLAQALTTAGASSSDLSMLHARTHVDHNVDPFTTQPMTMSLWQFISRLYTALTSRHSFSALCLTWTDKSISTSLTRGEDAVLKALYPPPRHMPLAMPLAPTALYLAQLRCAADAVAQYGSVSAASLPHLLVLKQVLRTDHSKCVDDLATQISHVLTAPFTWRALKVLVLCPGDYALPSLPISTSTTSINASTTLTQPLNVRLHGLGPALAFCPNLVHLGLAQTSISDLRGLAVCPELQSLDLSNSAAINDAIISFTASARPAPGTQVPGSAKHALVASSLQSPHPSVGPSLDASLLTPCTLHAASPAASGYLSSDTNIILSLIKPSVTPLVSALTTLLVECPGITHLNLERASLTNESMVLISSFSNLTHLSLAATSIQNLAFLWPLRCLPFLRSLQLQDTVLATRRNYRANVLALMHDQITGNCMLSPATSELSRMLTIAREYAEENTHVSTNSAVAIDSLRIAAETVNPRITEGRIMPASVNSRSAIIPDESAPAVLQFTRIDLESTRGRSSPVEAVSVPLVSFSLQRNSLYGSALAQPIHSPDAGRASFLQNILNMPFLLDGAPPSPSELTAAVTVAKRLADTAKKTIVYSSDGTHVSGEDFFTTIAPFARVCNDATFSNALITAIMSSSGDHAVQTVGRQFPSSHISDAAIRIATDVIQQAVLRDQTVLTAITQVNAVHAPVSSSSAASPYINLPLSALACPAPDVTHIYTVAASVTGFQRDSLPTRLLIAQQTASPRKSDVPEIPDSQIEFLPFLPAFTSRPLSAAALLHIYPSHVLAGPGTTTYASAILRAIDSDASVPQWARTVARACEANTAAASNAVALLLPLAPHVQAILAADRATLQATLGVAAVNVTALACPALLVREEAFADCFLGAGAPDYTAFRATQDDRLRSEDSRVLQTPKKASSNPQAGNHDSVPMSASKTPGSVSKLSSAKKAKPKKRIKAALIDLGDVSDEEHAKRSPEGNNLNGESTRNQYRAETASKGNDKQPKKEISANDGTAAKIANRETKLTDGDFEIRLEPLAGDSLTELIIDSDLIEDNIIVTAASNLSSSVDKHLNSIPHHSARSSAKVPENRSLEDSEINTSAFSPQVSSERKSNRDTETPDEPPLPPPVPVAVASPEDMLRELLVAMPESRVISELLADSVNNDTEIPENSANSQVLSPSMMLLPAEQSLPTETGTTSLDLNPDRDAFIGLASLLHNALSSLDSDPIGAIQRETSQLKMAIQHEFTRTHKQRQSSVEIILEDDDSNPGNAVVNADTTALSRIAAMEHCARITRALSMLRYARDISQRIASLIPATIQQRLALRKVKMMNNEMQQLSPNEEDAERHHQSHLIDDAVLDNDVGNQYTYLNSLPMPASFPTVFNTSKPTSETTKTVIATAALPLQHSITQTGSKNTASTPQTMKITIADPAAASIAALLPSPHVAPELPTALSDEQSGEAQVLEDLLASILDSDTGVDLQGIPSPFPTSSAVPDVQLSVHEYSQRLAAPLFVPYIESVSQKPRDQVEHALEHPSSKCRAIELESSAVLDLVLALTMETSVVRLDVHTAAEADKQSEVPYAQWASMFGGDDDSFSDASSFDDDSDIDENKMYNDDGRRYNIAQVLPGDASVFNPAGRQDAQGLAPPACLVQPMRPAPAVLRVHTALDETFAAAAVDSDTLDGGQVGLVQVHSSSSHASGSHAPDRGLSLSSKFSSPSLLPYNATRNAASESLLTFDENLNNYGSPAANSRLGGHWHWRATPEGVLATHYAHAAANINQNIAARPLLRSEATSSSPVAISDESLQSVLLCAASVGGAAAALRTLVMEPVLIREPVNKGKEVNPQDSEASCDGAPALAYVRLAEHTSASVTGSLVHPPTGTDDAAVSTDPVVDIVGRQPGLNDDMSVYRVRHVWVHEGLLCLSLQSIVDANFVDNIDNHPPNTNIPCDAFLSYMFDSSQCIHTHTCMSPSSSPRQCTCGCQLCRWLVALTLVLQSAAPLILHARAVSVFPHVVNTATGVCDGACAFSDDEEEAEQEDDDVFVWGMENDASHGHSLGMADSVTLFDDPDTLLTPQKHSPRRISTPEKWKKYGILKFSGISTFPPYFFLFPAHTTRIRSVPLLLTMPSLPEMSLGKFSPFTIIPDYVPKNSPPNFLFPVSLLLLSAEAHTLVYTHLALPTWKQQQAETTQQVASTQKQPEDPLTILTNFLKSVDIPALIVDKDDATLTTPAKHSTTPTTTTDLTQTPTAPQRDLLSLYSLLPALYRRVSLLLASLHALARSSLAAGLVAVLDERDKASMTGSTRDFFGSNFFPGKTSSSGNSEQENPGVFCPGMEDFRGGYLGCAMAWLQHVLERMQGDIYAYSQVMLSGSMISSTASLPLLPSSLSLLLALPPLLAPSALSMLPPSLLAPMWAYMSLAQQQSDAPLPRSQTEHASHPAQLRYQRLHHYDPHERPHYANSTPKPAPAIPKPLAMPCLDPVSTLPTLLLLTRVAPSPFATRAARGHLRAFDSLASSVSKKLKESVEMYRPLHLCNQRRWQESGSEEREDQPHMSAKSRDSLFDLDAMIDHGGTNTLVHAHSASKADDLEKEKSKKDKEATTKAEISADSKSKSQSEQGHHAASADTARDSQAKKDQLAAASANERSAKPTVKTSQTSLALSSGPTVAGKDDKSHEVAGHGDTASHDAELPSCDDPVCGAVLLGVTALCAKCSQNQRQAAAQAMYHGHFNNNDSLGKRMSTIAQPRLSTLHSRNSPAMHGLHGTLAMNAPYSPLSPSQLPSQRRQSPMLPPTTHPHQQLSPFPRPNEFAFPTLLPPQLPVSPVTSAPGSPALGASASSHSLTSALPLMPSPIELEGASSLMLTLPVLTPLSMTFAASLSRALNARLGQLYAAFSHSVLTDMDSLLNSNDADADLRSTSLMDRPDTKTKDDTSNITHTGLLHQRLSLSDTPSQLHLVDTTMAMWLPHLPRPSAVLAVLSKLTTATSMDWIVTSSVSSAKMGATTSIGASVSHGWVPKTASLLFDPHSSPLLDDNVDKTPAASSTSFTFLCADPWSSTATETNTGSVDNIPAHDISNPSTIDDKIDDTPLLQAYLATSPRPPTVSTYQHHVRINTRAQAPLSIASSLLTPTMHSPSTDPSLPSSSSTSSQLPTPSSKLSSPSRTIAPGLPLLLAASAADIHLYLPHTHITHASLIAHTPAPTLTASRSSPRLSSTHRQRRMSRASTRARPSIMSSPSSPAPPTAPTQMQLQTLAPAQGYPHQDLVPVAHYPWSALRRIELGQGLQSLRLCFLVADWSPVDDRERSAKSEGSQSQHKSSHASHVQWTFDVYTLLTGSPQTTHAIASCLTRLANALYGNAPELVAEAVIERASVTAAMWLHAKAMLACLEATGTSTGRAIGQERQLVLSAAAQRARLARLLSSVLALSDAPASPHAPVAGNSSQLLSTMLDTWSVALTEDPLTVSIQGTVIGVRSQVQLCKGLGFASQKNASTAMHMHGDNVIVDMSCGAVDIFSGLVCQNQDPRMNHSASDPCATNTSSQNAPSKPGASPSLPLQAGALASLSGTAPVHVTLVVYGQALWLLACDLARVPRVTAASGSLPRYFSKHAEIGPDGPATNIRSTAGSSQVLARTYGARLPGASGRDPLTLSSARDLWPREDHPSLGSVPLHGDWLCALTERAVAARRWYNQHHRGLVPSVSKAVTNRGGHAVDESGARLGDGNILDPISLAENSSAECEPSTVAHMFGTVASGVRVVGVASKTDLLHHQMRVISETEFDDPIIALVLVFGKKDVFSTIVPDAEIWDITTTRSNARRLLEKIL